MLVSKAMKMGALKYAKYLISCIDAHIINCYAIKHVTKRN